MSHLALSASFYYLWYGSTTIINIVILSVREANFDDRRQSLTSLDVKSKGLIKTD